MGLEKALWLIEEGVRNRKRLAAKIDFGKMGGPLSSAS